MKCGKERVVPAEPAGMSRHEGGGGEVEHPGTGHRISLTLVFFRLGISALA